MIAGYVVLGLIILMIVLVIWEIYRGISASKDVEWYQLITSEGKDGKQYTSATKVCLLVTFFVSTMFVTWIVFQVNWKDRPVEVIGLVIAWMAFGAGVEGYAKHLRSKADVAKPAG